MRRGLAVVVLVVVGCSSATETTTTNAEQAVLPQAEAVLSTITFPATTACADDPNRRVLVDDRGFVCPPTLPEMEDIEGSNRHRHERFGMLPGTYQTRLFGVPLVFTHTSQFLTFGEKSRAVFLYTTFCDVYADCRQVALLHDATGQLEPTQRNCPQCVVSADSSEVTLFGKPAILHDLLIDGSSQLVGYDAFTLANEGRIHLYAIELEDGSNLFVHVSASPPDTFDDFNQTIALPLLGTVELSSN